MKNWRLEKLFSLTATIAFIFFTAAAALVKPEFVFLEDYLSELGRQGLSATLFNSGQIITAIFVALSFASLALLAKKENNFLSLLASFAGITSAASLAAIAAYPIHAEPQHSLAVYAFFSTAAIAVLLASLSALTARKNNYALLVSVGAAEVISSLLLAQYKTATLQVATIALFGAWMLCTALLASSDGKN